MSAAATMPNGEPVLAQSASSTEAQETIQASAASAAATASSAEHTSRQALPSIQELYKEHKVRAADLRRQSAESWQRAQQQAVVTGTTLAAASNDAVVEMFRKEEKIEVALEELTQRTERLKKQMQQWAALVLKLNSGLKQLGDLGHWASTIESDVHATVDVLEELSARKRRAVGADK